MIKKRDIKKWTLSDPKRYLKKEELDAIDSFNGTGFYNDYQNSKAYPYANIFDTRQSFLLKMHDPVVCTIFLNNLDKLNNFLGKEDYFKFSNGKASWS